MASRREKLIEGARPYVEEHPIGWIPIALRGHALMVGDERIWVHPFAGGDAREIASPTAS